MSKLSQIRQIVKESQELVQEVHQEAKEAVESYNLTLEEFKVVQEGLKQVTVEELQEALDAIDNLEAIESEPEIVEESEELGKIEVPAAYQVEEPTEGTFKAKLVGLLFFILTFGGLAAAGAYMRHINLLSIDANNWRKTLEDALGFYSDLITQAPQSGPALGGIVVLAAAVGVGYLFYFFLMNGAASKNLKRAEEMFEEVKQWVEEQKSFIQKVKELQSVLKEALHTFEGLKLFGDEFAKRTKRATFFEGNDFEAMNSKAKDEVRTAQTLREKLSLLASLKLYSEELQLRESVQNSLYEAKSYMELLKGKING